MFVLIQVAEWLIVLAMIPGAVLTARWVSKKTGNLGMRSIRDARQARREQLRSGAVADESRPRGSGRPMGRSSSVRRWSYP